MSFSLDSFYDQYEVVEKQVTVNGRRFRFLSPRTIDRFIDPEHPLNGFPLWAKLWEASLVLADFMARRKPYPSGSVLEIGSGLGAVAMVASAFGHNILATEYNLDALAFSRANAAISDCRSFSVAYLDWYHPDIEGFYDLIIGSDVVYREADFKSLLNIFNRYLKPDGEIILAFCSRKTDTAFFEEMQPYFSIGVQKKILKTEDKTVDILLCRMTHRNA